MPVTCVGEESLVYMWPYRRFPRHFVYSRSSESQCRLQVALTQAPCAQKPICNMCMSRYFTCKNEETLEKVLVIDRSLLILMCSTCARPPIKRNACRPNLPWACSTTHPFLKIFWSDDLLEHTILTKEAVHLISSCWSRFSRHETWMDVSLRKRWFAYTLPEFI